MSVTLTPDQQAKLDQFETDAQAAADAQTAAYKSASDLLTLTDQNNRNQQAALDDTATALQSGQSFIDAMLGRTPTPPATMAKKK